MARLRPPCSTGEASASGLGAAYRLRQLPPPSLRHRTLFSGTATTTHARPTTDTRVQPFAVDADYTIPHRRYADGLNALYIQCHVAAAARKALLLSSPFAPPTETTRSTSAPLAAPGSRAGCAAGSRPACAARIGSSAPSSCATCREWRRRTRRGQAPVPKGRARRRRRRRKRRRRTRPRRRRRRRRRPTPRPRLRWRTFGVCKEELQALYRHHRGTPPKNNYIENPD